MRRIEIYDTTLRDGSQGEGVSFSLQDKLLLTEQLDRLGFDLIEGGYPLSNDKDAQFFQRMQSTALSHARLAAFGMTHRKGVAPHEDIGLQALVDAGTSVITLVGKTWDLHATEVLRVGLEENLDMIAASVAFLREAGRDVIYDAEHFFDGWKNNRDYALQTIRAAAAAGARIVVLCDTNGGSMPDEVARATMSAMDALGMATGIHCHNDCELAVANSLAAVDAGACHVQGTINGVGERCGNADLISVVANLALKKGYEVLAEGSVEHLTELSRYMYELANLNYRPSQPFVGSSAFAHKGGMHVHAVNRLSRSYEHIPPERVGNTRRVLVSELSGRSNIMALTAKINLQHDRELMDRILAQVVALENLGFQFEAAEGSFFLLVQKCAGTFKPHFERLKFHVSVEADGLDQGVTTEASVKLKVAGNLRHVVAEGDGPVNALDAALRKALSDDYPNLSEMHLVDYKVRVINSEAGTAAGVRVVIESRDQHEVWGTIGVSENVIEASWMALVDSIEYKLLKDKMRLTEASQAQPLATVRA